MVISLCKWFLPAFFALYPVNNAIVPAAHPFYVSVVDINHDAKAKELQVSCKMFTNDFEIALEKAVNGKVDLSDAREKPAAEKAIAGYLSQHLRISVDGKPLTLSYVGFELEAEAAWVYLQASEVPAFRKIDIFDNMLYEYFPSQINILHVSVSGNRKSTKMANPEANAALEF